MRLELHGKRGKGSYALIDDDDSNRVGGVSWSVHPKGYVTRGTRRLAREIMNCPHGLEVDHINHDKLDNRRCNLRIVTRQQNNQNTRPKTSSTRTSAYKGVHLAKGKWRASIHTNGTTRQLGTFTDEVAAAKAYDQAARYYFGEYAYLNF